MSEPKTEAGRKLDLAWPGTHMDRLDWQAAIVAVEGQAASRETARDALALLKAARDSGVMLAATEATKLAAALSSPETTPAGVLDEAALRVAVGVVVTRWYKAGLLRFSSRDDGSDDLLLRDEIVRALAAALGRSGSGGGRG